MSDKLKETINSLFDGDNLEVMRSLGSNTVDLIYADPPFNSKKNYNSLYTDPTGTTHKSQIKQFEDVWYWTESSEKDFNDLRVSNPSAFKYINYLIGVYGYASICSYLAFISVRLIEMRRLLKDTGSIYLHCDSSADYHLRVIMDCVFGAHNFRNTIAWCYTGASRAKSTYPKKHDTIFFYSKTSDYVFNYKAHTIPYKSVNTGVGTYGKMDKKMSAEYIKAGKMPEDYWDIERDFERDRQEDVFNIPCGGAIQHELFGYPTQKPLELLLRLIATSSNVGSVILDPFIGSGTTMEASYRLGRNCIGIDKNIDALRITNKRVVNILYNKEFKLELSETIAPSSIEEVRRLAKKDWSFWQGWSNGQITAMSGLNPNGGGDGGADGWVRYGKNLTGLVSAKVSANPACVRELFGAVTKHGADFGILNCLDASAGVLAEAMRYGTIQNGSGRIDKIQVNDLNRLYKMKAGSELTCQLKNRLWP